MDKTSREYARKLRLLADWLDSLAEFDIDGPPFLYVQYYTRDSFVRAVMATKPGAKETTNGQYPEVKFVPAGRPEGMTVQLSVARDQVCTKVQDVKWECEPILSQADIASLDEVAV